MSPYICDQEESVIRAVRTGIWDDQLRQHAAACGQCAEIMLVVTGLSADAQFANAECVLPDAATVWRKVQLECDRRNLAKATWPISLAWRLGYVFGGILLLWQFFTSDASQRSMQALRGAFSTFVNVSAASSLSPAVLASLLTGSVALVCVLLGSLYMTRADA